MSNYLISKNHEHLILEYSKNINQGSITFNKAIQDFGDSMDKMTSELSSDVKKSNMESEDRAKRNQENLDKIWGKKK